MPLGIDVRNSRELRAAFLAVRNADTVLRREIRAGLKTFTMPEWSGAVLEHTRTLRQTKVLGNTAKVRASDQNIRLSSGDAAKKLSGGGKARDLAHAEEFGAGDRVKSYTSHRGGTSYRTTRHTTRQFGPPRRKGYAVYQAAAAVIPRVASMAVQTIVRTLLDAVEGKQK